MAKLTLYPYQEEGAQWLRERRTALLCDEMGLGKTAQALRALPDERGAVVVCPAHLKHNWHNEAKLWAPDLKVTIFSGRQKVMIWPDVGELFILSYSILPEVVSTADVAPALIADEAHYIKNTSSKRHKKFAKLAARCNTRWLLTATPMEDKPLDLWGVLHSVRIATTTFGTLKKFIKMFNGKKFLFMGRFPKWTWGAPSEKAGQLLREVALIRTKADMLDLPGKIYKELEVEIKIPGLDDPELLAAVHHRQPSPPLQAMRRKVAEAKIPFLLSWIEQAEYAQTPVVVFSAHLGPVERLAGRPGWRTITGATPAAKRARYIEELQAGELLGLAGTIGAMGSGVTLHHAAHMLFVDLAWTPSTNRQAEDRIHRIGQESTCFYTYLVGDHEIERRMAKILRHKETIEDALYQKIA